MAHKCNANRCHKCPDLGGEIMPGCMGTAAFALGPHDMSRCTCKRGRDSDEPSEIVKMKREIKRLGPFIETRGCAERGPVKDQKRFNRRLKAISTEKITVQISGEALAAIKKIMEVHGCGQGRAIEIALALSNGKATDPNNFRHINDHPDIHPVVKSS